MEPLFLGEGRKIKKKPTARSERKGPERGRPIRVVAEKETLLGACRRGRKGKGKGKRNLTPCTERGQTVPQNREKRKEKKHGVR